MRNRHGVGKETVFYEEVEAVASQLLDNPIKPAMSINFAQNYSEKSVDGNEEMRAMVGVDCPNNLLQKWNIAFDLLEKQLKMTNYM